MGRGPSVHLVVLAAAVAVVILAVAVGYLSPRNTRGGVYLAILALAALLALEVYWTRSSVRPRVAAAGRGKEAYPELVIRCRSCNEVFTVVDTGERPLIGTCTNCGKSGTVKRAGV